MEDLPNNFPRYMQHAVEVCAQGHIFVECGVPTLVPCPACRRHGEEERRKTKGNNKEMKR